MMAAVSAAALRVGKSGFGRWCGKVSDVIDCIIPIVLVTALAVGSASIALGLIQ
jgi:hypothetical protein